MSFLCGCTALIGLNTIVEVHLTSGAAPFTGKARVTQVDSPGTGGQRRDFEFVEKPIDWILQQAARISQRAVLVGIRKLQFLQ